jgi:uncharacterized protein (TIGR02145 family)
MEQNILSDIERLKHDYADLKAEIHELSNAFNQAQVSNSRKRGVYTSAGATCEAILKFIYQKDSTNQKPANKMMLDELLIKVADELPVQVMINFRTIQAWRNLGTHDKDDMRNIDSNSLIMIDMALTNIVNWFFSSHLNIEVPNSKTSKIDKKEEATKTIKSKTKSEINSSPTSKAKKPTHEKEIKSVPKKTVTKKQLAKTESPLRDQPLLESIGSNLEKVQTRIENYAQVKLGNQIWMLENLSVIEFRNGDSIRQARTKAEWLEAGENCEPVWCFYRSDAKGDRTPGLLYNWYAVNDPRCLAPKGWRIPNSDDFKELISFCGGENYVQKRFYELTGLKGIFRRKHTGTYTNHSNFAWWTSSFGRLNGYCFEFVSSRFCESGFPKGTGFPIVCIRATAQ